MGVLEKCYGDGHKWCILVGYSINYSRENNQNLTILEVTERHYITLYRTILYYNFCLAHLTGPDSACLPPLAQAGCWMQCKRWVQRGHSIPEGTLEAKGTKKTLSWHLPQNGTNNMKVCEVNMWVGVALVLTDMYQMNYWAWVVATAWHTSLYTPPPPNDYRVRYIHTAFAGIQVFPSMIPSPIYQEIPILWLNFMDWNLIRGGPFDIQGGGGLWFFFLSKLFFSFPRPNNKSFSLVDPNKKFSPLGHETNICPPNIKLAGTETEQRDNFV